MITISKNAAKQIKLSAEQSDSGDMSLRIAAKVKDDKSIEYGVGFDDIRENDIQVSEGGVNILISPEDEELLKGAHLDFVEIEPGNFNFIFQNPNDPNYKPPTETEPDDTPA